MLISCTLDSIIEGKSSVSMSKGTYFHGFMYPWHYHHIGAGPAAKSVATYWP